MVIKIDREDTGSFNEFVGQIIDTFEDFLEARNVELRNEERDQDEDAAIIYGSDYGELYDGIETLLVNWSEDKETRNEGI